MIKNYEEFVNQRLSNRSMTVDQIAKQTGLIGIDTNIEECVRSGYMIVDTEGNRFSPNKEFRLIQFVPDDALEEQHIHPDTADRFDYTLIDDKYSWDEMVELYKEDSKEIDSCGDLKRNTNFKNPDFYDFVYLANVISSYTGLP